MQPNFVIRNSADLSLSNCQSSDPRLRVIVIAIFAGIIAGGGYYCAGIIVYKIIEGTKNLRLKNDCGHL